MRYTLTLFVACAALTVVSPARAQEPPPTQPPVTREPTDLNRPRTVPGFDVAALDRTVEPCVDFYRFSCGGWIDRNPVPADRPRWGRFNELSDRNLEQLRVLLEKVAGPDPRRNPVDLVALGAARGMTFTADELREAYKVDWAMRLGRYSSRTKPDR